MTKEEFVEAYCARSGVTWEELSKYEVALPCACGDENCPSWAMVTNNPSAIKSHNDLYAPAELSQPKEPQ